MLSLVVFEVNLCLHLQSDLRKAEKLLEQFPQRNPSETQVVQSPEWTLCNFIVLSIKNIVHMERFKRRAYTFYETRNVEQLKTISSPIEQVMKLTMLIIQVSSFLLSFTHYFIPFLTIPRFHIYFFVLYDHHSAFHSKFVGLN